MKTIRGFIWGLLLVVSSLLVGLTMWYLLQRKETKKKTSYGRYSDYRSK